MTGPRDVLITGVDKETPGNETDRESPKTTDKASQEDLN